jgi:hypothetical protein
VVRVRHRRHVRLPVRPLRFRAERPYARRVSWSAQHDHEHELEHRIEPPDPQEREREEPLHQLASDVGNASFSNVLARDGAGIMETGEVHPDVQAKIDSTRGSGAAPDAGTQARLSPHLGSFHDVTFHTDETADQLNRSVNAKAFATGTDVYFSKGSYNPGSADGDELIAHELAHVVQQRGAPNSGPLTVSQPGDDLEDEAERVAKSV